MTSLGMLVAGFLIVIADLRIKGFDLITDPIGWVLALVALAGLTRLHWGFTLAAASSVAGLIVSVGSIQQPTEGLLGTAESIVMTGVVFGTCSAILALSSSARDRRAADVIRWVDLALTVFVVASSPWTPDEKVDVSGAAAFPLVALVILALGVVIWFLLLVWRVRREPAYAPDAR